MRAGLASRFHLSIVYATALFEGVLFLMDEPGIARGPGRGREEEPGGPGGPRRVSRTQEEPGGARGIQE